MTEGLVPCLGLQGEEKANDLINNVHTANSPQNLKAQGTGALVAPDTLSGVQLGGQGCSVRGPPLLACRPSGCSSVTFLISSVINGQT